VSWDERDSVFVFCILTNAIELYVAFGLSITWGGRACLATRRLRTDGLGFDPVLTVKNYQEIAFRLQSGANFERIEFLATTGAIWSKSRAYEVFGKDRDMLVGAVTAF
jgi:hypothetical protein